MMTDLTSLRVDQLGSLVRPQFLRDTFDRHARGDATDDELRIAQDLAVEDVVREQEGLGLPIVGDGEFRRRTFTDSHAGVRGFRQQPPMSGQMELTRNRPLEEYRFTAALSERPVKLTILSADRVWQLSLPRQPRQISPDDDAFLSRVVTVHRQIIGELVDAGCTYIQVDGPGYAAYTDPGWIAHLRGRGLDPITALRRSAAADGAAIGGFPGVTFGIHICPGDRPPDQHGDWSYDGIAEILFNSLPHDRVLLECDPERTSFDSLRFVPKGKVAVLGLISTRTPQLETEDDLLRRIDDASKYLDADQLALSTQCGFASGIDEGRCTPSEQWRKLELMLRVADRAWMRPAHLGVHR